MKQVIEWKEIDENTPTGEYYHLLSKEEYNLPKIVSGRLIYYDGHNVWIELENVEVRFPLNYFSHYAEVEG